jgi:hypothetical protein
MESLGNDVTAILRQNSGWVRKYQGETNPVKAQLDGEISKMKVHNRTRLTNFNPGFKVKKSVFRGHV